MSSHVSHSSRDTGTEVICSKRICFLKRDLSGGGGLEKYTSRLAEAFSAQGHEVHFISNDEAPQPYTTHFVTPSGSFSYQKIRNFNRKCERLVDKLCFDVVIGMDRTCRQSHLRAGNGVHRAFLHHRKAFDSYFKQLTHRFNPLNHVVLDIEKRGFESPGLKTIFTNSEMVKREILHYYNVDPDKITVIHNGVEWMQMGEAFDCWAETKWENAKRLKLDPHTFHFLFIGHGFNRKGLEPLLCALSLIRHLDFHLSVVGSDRRLPHYRALASSLGLEKRVTFFGMQKTQIFYQLADCLVIPSYYDPCANVTMEALAMGLRVVSSQNNGGCEVLNNANGSIIRALDDIPYFAQVLMEEMDRPKTACSSQAIRSSCSHLDFSLKLKEYLQLCLS